ncbi:NAD(P)H-quinone oxidoreductase [Caballeronia sp. GaOx3]|uniref:NAD(P)H-quinone oxidoreductase n=1 Tax=Caballeronia sp. GaOx3 TaxID=2921740 RepID=UPI002029905D|nr:NAD(P)H-quinone oxidoreductase [Caballeronia sp. GaOx3]
MENSPRDDSMTVVEIRNHGGPDVLVPARRPIPVPTDGQVLIKVSAAGVNRADLMQREGKYPMPPGAPADVPGLEVSGTVVRVGKDVTRWQKGDHVCALLIGQGYAEYAVAPEAQCMAVPPSVSLIDAGGVPETFCTVWTNLVEQAGLKTGEVLLIQGGSSGIGVTAILLAKALGATVLVTAGSDAKCTACLDLGADLAINYRNEDFKEAALTFTNGHGVDVILDIVGPNYVEREIELLKRFGRLVFVGLMSGSRANVELTGILLKRLNVTGSSLRAYSHEEKGALCRALETRVWPLFATGQVRVVTHATFPLTAAADAHRLLESSAHIGKVLLTP